jgi:hypothetical protein
MRGGRLSPILALVLSRSEPALALIAGAQRLAAAALSTCEPIAAKGASSGAMAAAKAPIQREWFPPEGAGQPKPGGLSFYNSLLDEKVLFVPSGGAASKQVSWYGCGPTVYDAAHVGHARNFVTFDILRRVMEDYFGYNIQFVMNVTDVDDKIILRARRNHLLAQYRAGATSAADVRPLNAMRI